MTAISSVRLASFAALACLALPCTAQEPELVPVDEKGLPQAIDRGVEILLEMQEAYKSTGDGDVASEWPYEGVYRERGEIPPGYRVGGTSICAWALLEAPGWKKDKARREAVERGLEFVLDLLETKRMDSGFSGGYDVRGWGHAYALNFLLKMREMKRVPKKHAKAVDTKIKWLIQTLVETEIEAGGWNYARRGGGKASTFMTAPTLQFLFYAKEQGEDVDEDVLMRGLEQLELARLDTGAYQYSTNPDNVRGTGFEAVEGSTGRSPVCETTLLLAGRGSVERVRLSLDQFFEHWEWLEQRRRQDRTHIPPFMIAPYYFFFAHFYAAQAIEQLPEKDRAEYRVKLYALFDKVREGSGGWNDRVFPRSENFGTAMTILGLMQPDVTRPAGWEGDASSRKKK